jgi:signal-transduction protein with cAMP-binding, CBS, and nucleotidyltransferase domain
MIKVSDVMTSPVVTIRTAATVAEAIQRMLNHSIHTLIVDRQHPQDAYGILTNLAILHQVVAFGRDPKRVRVFEIMTKPCIVVNPDLGLEYAAQLFRNTGIHAAPVIQSELLGLLSATDMLKHEAILNSPREALLTAQLEEAKAKAEKLCYQFGAGSLQCAEGWARVEGLETELAHQQSKTIDKTAYELFREANPTALDLDEYDAWCSG